MPLAPSVSRLRAAGALRRHGSPLRHRCEPQKDYNAVLMALEKDQDAIGAFEVLTEVSSPSTVPQEALIMRAPLRTHAPLQRPKRAPNNCD